MDLPIPRVQLFEFNDSPWAPAALRDTIIESLSRTLAWGRILRGLVAPFEQFLQQSGAAEVLDVCAGAGGPAKILASEIARAGRRPPRFLMCDLQPQPDAWQAAREAQPGVIDFVAEPVDATAIPEALSRGRARTIINALHHFSPELVSRILADAVAGGTGVFVAEGFSRNPLGFASFAPAGLLALAVNPALSSRDRLAKALLTWASPVVLAASVWDGVVSTLRVYTESELRALIAPFGGDFRWTFGSYPFPPFGRGTYFYGVPAR